MPAAYAGQPLAALIPTLPNGEPSSTTIPLASMSPPKASARHLHSWMTIPQTNERIWREMTGTSFQSATLSPYSKPKPTAHVLLAASTPGQSAAQEAFLSWQYVGLGRVVYLAAPVTYQLRYQMGDLYHHRFWGQLLRWSIAREMSTGSKTVRLFTDKTEYNKGETAQIAVRLSSLDGAPVGGAECVVEARQDGRVNKIIPLKEEPDSPGAYRGTMENLAAGTFTLRAEGPTVESLLKTESRTEPVEQVITVDLSGSSEMNNPLCNLPFCSTILPSTPAAVPSLRLLPSRTPSPTSEPSLMSWKPLSVTTLFGTNGYTCGFSLASFLGAEWIARKVWRMGLVPSPDKSPKSPRLRDEATEDFGGGNGRRAARQDRFQGVGKVVTGCPASLPVQGRRHDHQSGHGKPDSSRRRKRPLWE